MRRHLVLVGLCAWAAMSRLAAAAEHRVEPLGQGPPTAGVSRQIAEKLSPTGFKVVQGEDRTVCEVWPCDQWPVSADFTPSNTILYPFEVGQLVGLVRYPKKGGDFRGQEITPGLYTLRYAQQPVDGNHVGTSDTRDFLLLVRVADDADPQPLAKVELFKRSAKAAGTTHPAMLSLLAAGEAESLPAMVHHLERDLWSVRFANKSLAGSKTNDLVVELVVVGQAAE